MLPKIPNLELAAYYRTSRWAGGDYYDFFPLPDGRWGILVADVSGHGTPAAVMMAIMSQPGAQPGRAGRPACRDAGISQPAVVDALHGCQRGVRHRVLCASTTRPRRTLSYSSAGHNPPRLIRCRDGTVQALEEVGGPPLGLDEDLEYEETTFELQPGDVMAFYTDGITEAMDARGTQFGTDSPR